MPGPLPNAALPNSRRRPRWDSGPGSGLVLLPAEGCDLPVPPIPRGRKWVPHERELWRELWTSPQARQWDDSYRTAVAAYICHATALMAGEASAWQAQEFRHLGDKLGLTPAGMAALGWRIDDSGGAS